MVEAESHQRQGQNQTQTAAEDDPARIITPEELGMDITPAERRRAAEKRDNIAKQMWRDYQIELQRRRSEA